LVARGRVRQKKSARADMESAPTAYGSASSMTRGSFRRHKVPAGSPLQSIFGEVLLCFLLFFAQQHTVGFPAQHQQDLQLVRAQLQTGPPKQLQQPLGIPLLCQAGILLRQLQQPLLKLTVRIECPVEADGILKFERCPLFSAFPKPFHTDSPILRRPFIP